MLTNGFSTAEVVACQRNKTVVCIKPVVLQGTNRTVFTQGAEYSILSADWQWVTLTNDEGKPHILAGTFFREHFAIGHAADQAQ